MYRRKNHLELEPLNKKLSIHAGLKRFKMNPVILNHLEPFCEEG